jgi:hypothetical protein
LHTGEDWGETFSDFTNLTIVGKIPSSIVVGAMAATRWIARNTSLYRIDVARLTVSGGLFPSRLNRSVAGYLKPRHFRVGFIGLALVLAAAFGGWMFLSRPGDPEAGDVTVGNGPVLATAAASKPEVAPQDGFLLNPEAAPEEGAAAAVDGLKISSQRWRRGGLGSKALVTFTIRNRNLYAVKDIEIFCAFSRRDGSHLTDRTRVIHDTVKMRGRKTFAGLHVGFVNVNADRAKCSLLSASHI